MKLNINDDIVIVNGAEADAIYDFNKKKLYRVNKDAGKFLDNIDDNNFNVSKISENDKEFIEACLDMGILTVDKKISEKKNIEKFIDTKIINEFCWLEITSFCNQKCIHCFMAEDLNKNYLPSEAIFKVIEGLKNLNIKTIALSGGEPTLHPDFEKIVKFINKNNINIVVLTNGLNINDKLISLFRETNTVIRIPLLGLEKTHDKITSVKNSYHTAMTNIKKLKEAKINITITSTIMSINIDEMDELRRLATQLGLSFEVGPIFPIGNAKKNWNIIKPKNYQELLNTCNGCELECLSNQNSKKNTSINIPNKINKYPECGVKNIAITTTGKYVPCLLLRDSIFNMGSILKDKIENLITNKNEKFKKVQEKLSYTNLKPCSKCEVRYVCKGGGCKAVNYLINNELEYRNPYYLNCYYKR
ncbi:radical SAM protein [Clostridium botulinum]|uniref:radical SAM/SPASM domain-containing protein n=1 Tax=Clostridium botulinum TaxID=1491 RepID=UPI00077316BF|nr:radical SAM protein [Clostridium botulinum]NFE96235.1 radical SAM protein [Clostridium botulinum]NFI54509.1 radical SAM protein [Clostridium botulinum]NFL39772.1 radical SAM protein [Clostridium botulinum]NFL66640.1 radical SAM protein [Clostridium botulinum]NFN09633.1 radical SAM protein [Clostridium botulinum]